MIRFYIDTFKELGFRGSLATFLLALIVLITSYSSFIVLLKIAVFIKNI